MEDRFKFRMWDAEANQMYYFDLGSITRGGVTGSGWVRDINGVQVELDGNILMPCTGAWVAENNLVYECDILMETDWTGHETIKEVKYNYLKWGFYLDYIDRTDENVAQPLSMELKKSHDARNHVILGNIHENPELLNSR